MARLIIDKKRKQQAIEEIAARNRVLEKHRNNLKRIADPVKINSVQVATAKPISIAIDGDFSSSAASKVISSAHLSTQPLRTLVQPTAPAPVRLDGIVVGEPSLPVEESPILDFGTPTYNEDVSPLPYTTPTDECECSSDDEDCKCSAFKRFCKKRKKCIIIGSIIIVVIVGGIILISKMRKK